MSVLTEAELALLDSMGHERVITGLGVRRFARTTVVSAVQLDQLFEIIQRLVAICEAQQDAFERLDLPWPHIVSPCACCETMRLALAAMKKQPHTQPPLQQGPPDDSMRKRGGT